MSTESFAARVDAITAEDLRIVGGTKWDDPDVMGAFIAEMDFGVAPAITEALHVAVDEGAFGYTPPRYTSALKEATSSRLNSHHGWATTPADVFPVPDVITALEVAIAHFSRPGSKVIVPTPSYMPFLTVPGMIGREVIEVPMLEVDGVWSFDLDGLQAAFDAGGNCLLLCNPFNPLGRVFTRDELLAVSEVVERNDGRVFSDEIWAPLVYSGAELVPYATINPTTAGHTITGTAASKAWNIPGLKCAQIVVSNTADQGRMTELAHWAGRGTATPGIIASTAAYTEGDEWLAETVAYLEGNRDELVELVAEHLPGVKLTVPEATYVGWLDFRGVGLANPAAFFREHAGVGLTDGGACGEAGVGSGRFIFAMPRPLMREAIERMGRALRAN
ncbi:MalY/PatB family protein [Leucobacter sp. BZR 635]